MRDPLGGTAADAPSRHRRDPYAPPWYMRPLVWALAFIMELMSLRRVRKPEPAKSYTVSDLYDIKREIDEARWGRRVNYRVDVLLNPCIILGEN